MKKDRELLSTLKVNKKTLIIGIFIIIVSLIGGIILYLLVTKDDAISMRDADHLEMYAQIEGEISSVFATSNNDGKLEKYYLINNNDFYYIIKSIEDMTSNTIFGKTKEIPNEIKEYATLYLKEIGLDINDNNFSNYVSNYLLDSTYNKSDELVASLSINSCNSLQYVLTGEESKIIIQGYNFSGALVPEKCK